MTSFSLISFGAARAGNQHRADDEVGLQHVVLDRLPGREDGVDRGAELLVERVQPLDVDVDAGDGRLEPDGHAHGVDARDAAADDDDVGRRDAGRAAEQHAASALLHLQAVRAGLDRHAAGNLAHRREQRQPAARARHRLVGDGRHARAHQLLGLVRIGRQMQVGEQRLALAQHLALGRLRLLHLHDQVGVGEDLRGVGSDRRADLAIVVVGKCRCARRRRSRTNTS